jgi:hypothetical protein
MSPPENALVLCVDEKSQIQALDRTAPCLPMLPATPARMTHDYVRNGTTSLFAALDLASGSVIAQPYRRHRHQEFLRFLKLIDAAKSSGAAGYPVSDKHHSGTTLTDAVRSMRLLPTPTAHDDGKTPEAHRAMERMGHGRKEITSLAVVAQTLLPRRRRTTAPPGPRRRSRSRRRASAVAAAGRPRAAVPASPTWLRSCRRCSRRRTRGTPRAPTGGSPPCGRTAGCGAG